MREPVLFHSSTSYRRYFSTNIPITFKPSQTLRIAQGGEVVNARDTVMANGFIGRRGVTQTTGKEKPGQGKPRAYPRSEMNTSRPRLHFGALYMLHTRVHPKVCRTHHMTGLMFVPVLYTNVLAFRQMDTCLSVTQRLPHALVCRLAHESIRKSPT